MAGPRDWTPRKPLEFGPLERKILRNQVLNHPEPERFYILGSTLTYIYNELQWLFEEKKVPKELEKTFREMHRHIEDVLRGTPWDV